MRRTMKRTRPLKGEIEAGEVSRVECVSGGVQLVRRAEGMKEKRKNVKIKPSRTCKHLSYPGDETRESNI